MMIYKTTTSQPANEIQTDQQQALATVSPPKNELAAAIPLLFRLLIATERRLDFKPGQMPSTLPRSTSLLTGISNAFTSANTMNVDKTDKSEAVSFFCQRAEEIVQQIVGERKKQLALAHVQSNEELEEKKTMITNKKIEALLEYIQNPSNRDQRKKIDWMMVQDCIGYKMEGAKEKINTYWDSLSCTPKASEVIRKGRQYTQQVFNNLTLTLEKIYNANFQAAHATPSFLEDILQDLIDREKDKLILLKKKASSSQWVYDYLILMTCIKMEVVGNRLIVKLLKPIDKMRRKLIDDTALELKQVNQKKINRLKAEILELAPNKSENYLRDAKKYGKKVHKKKTDSFHDHILLLNFQKAIQSLSRVFYLFHQITLTKPRDKTYWYQALCNLGMNYENLLEEDRLRFYALEEILTLHGEQTLEDDFFLPEEMQFDNEEHLAAFLKEQPSQLIQRSVEILIDHDCDLSIDDDLDDFN